MKKMIFLVGLLVSVTALAENYDRTRMDDYIPTKMHYMFEIKTKKFDKVVLDCQSFITGMTFTKNKKQVHNIYLDMFQCEEVHNILNEAKNKNEKICLEVETSSNTLTISEDSADCQ